MKKSGLSRIFLLALVACCAWILTNELFAQSSNPLSVMPLPAHVVMGQGAFPIDAKFGIALEGHTEPRLERARHRFLDDLSRETGIPLFQEAQYNPANFTIKTAGPSDPVQQVGEDESYRLEISSNRVQLTAANPLGILHGLQTFLQMVQVTPQGFSVPAATIDDKPRFPWRGLLIDGSRHFIPVSVIERDLDGMEAVKMNVFHWHLSDDQGFRVESKKFPLLQEKGSDGLYYTQKQIHEVVQYARDRGIRVVPEFDIPCHTASWFVGYPQLASTEGPHHIARHFGVNNAAMDPTKESTYKFLDSFIGEMAALFPDKYFHVGGDECNGKEWDSNPRIQTFMRTHQYDSNAALQAYFTARVQKLVTRHHKVMAGWDEVLQPKTPKDVVIQAWGGGDGLERAARQGNPAIVSTGYYLNRYWSAARHYRIDPLGGAAANLSAEQKALVLGGEAAMWTEVADRENIDSRIWPRAAAIAERFWSPRDVRDVDSMYRRLPAVERQLALRGLDSGADVNKMLQRMSGNSNPAHLKVLASTVQPPVGYVGGKLPVPTVFTPLNRLIDVVPPESMTAYDFNMLAKQIVAGNATPRQWQQARQSLMLWRDNDAALRPLLAQSYLTGPLVPLSHNLQRVAVMGLQALNDLQDHRSADAEGLQKNIAFLKSLQKPQKTEPVLMVAPSVELLVNAAGVH